MVIHIGGGCDATGREGEIHTYYVIRRSLYLFVRQTSYKNRAHFFPFVFVDTVLSALDTEKLIKSVKETPCHNERTTEKHDRGKGADVHLRVRTEKTNEKEFKLTYQTSRYHFHLTLRFFSLLRRCSLWKNETTRTSHTRRTYRKI